MSRSAWSRRKFLGVVVPAAAVVACGPELEIVPTDESGTDAGPLRKKPHPNGGGVVEVPDAGTISNPPIDAGSFDAGYVPADAGVVEQHLCASNYPRLNLKTDLYAKGDGVTNDTAAFQEAARRIQNAGGGELIIPPGVYIVGNQTAKTSGTQSGPWYREADIFKVTNASCVKVSGYGAKLKLKSGLHYGGFDPTTGDPANMNSGPNNGAHAGRMIELQSCGNVLIEGLELDGNLGALVLGGTYGDLDRQTQATGIWVNMCRDVTIMDVYTHHHGLDGVTVLHLDGPPTVKKPHRLVRVNSEYNGRQALSWIGGWGLECSDCKFNHTGRGLNGGQPLASAPKAGLDIEPNANTTQISRDGVFTRCEFINNAGAGILGSVGNGGYSTFTDCVVWGTTYYSMWNTRPGMKFTRCNFHGTIVHAGDGHTPSDPNPNPALAEQYDSCLFEDKPWTDGRVYRNGNLINLGEGGEGVTWRGCTFINHQVRGPYIGGTTDSELFDSCRFVHSNSGLASGSYQSQFQGSRIKSCVFEESAAITNGTPMYYISLSNVTVLAPDPGKLGTRVVGQRVRWNSTGGSTGVINPGTYT